MSNPNLTNTTNNITSTTNNHVLEEEWEQIDSKLNTLQLVKKNTNSLFLLLFFSFIHILIFFLLLFLIGTINQTNTKYYSTFKSYSTTSNHADSI